MNQLCENHQILGTVTMSEKGQIVIPIEARKKLGLQGGDQLMIIAKGEIAIGLVKTSNLQALIDMLQDEVKHLKKSTSQ